MAEAKPPKPILNAMLICDQTIREELTGKISVIGIFGAIQSSRFPVYHHSLSIYANLGDAQGSYRLRLELLRADTMQAIGRAETTVEVRDRMLPAEFVFDLRQLVFDRPGRYQFELYANDESVGSRSFQVLLDAIPWRAPMSTIPEATVKTAASPVAPPKVLVDHFMLEDYLDAIDAKMALADPENADRIEWEQLKAELGL